MNKTILELQKIALTFPSMDFPILSDVNYQVRQGDFIIILGSNGSGKSSLMKIIDQRYQPTQGKLLLNNKPLPSYSRATLSRDIITLTQNPHDSLFTSLTILENYLLVKQRHETQLLALRNNKERAFFAEYLREFNPNLPNKLDQVVERLSGGEKQALGLALSVLYPPQILLLDEHTSALDPKSAEQLMALTHKIVTMHRITCLLTTHDLEIAGEYGNRVLALKHGQIYQTIDYAHKQQVTQQDLLAACY